ncbi:hypothetical protein N802_17135 [Knoellia sinensis KCTC 19936]|uniref:Uncharacterized protein n=1 Tax=Knoellia sinensis KCTC 19936 TaxID=1385520 RepID=A0A0A0J7B6_9MICO|nr:hypothetical protein [Knoellia sinensis]KGN32684.1 hypothetical protein N802_17135 [Knoellia sinensis KCTC 19936]
MTIARVINISIGVLTLVTSFAASWWRYAVDGAFGPSIVLTSAIFGFVAITLIMSLRRTTSSEPTTGNAGMVWLLLLILTTAATWEVIPVLSRPTVGILLALIAGLAIGVAVVPGMNIGTDADDSRGISRGRPGPWGGRGGRW